jgi:hypothetical protein
MADEQAMINEAIETFLESYLSIEVREKVTDLYGKGIAARVKAIYDDALKCPVDWRTATIDTALPVLHELLTGKYPWLSGKAKSKIVWAFIMEWK